MKSQIFNIVIIVLFIFKISVIVTDTNSLAVHDVFAVCKYYSRMNMRRMAASMDSNFVVQ
jgi:hypothetical protein